MKKGFTLAEVLITLGIIGIVAALTIPTLMNNIQDNEFKNKLKKEYSVLAQAQQLIAQENGGQFATTLASCTDAIPHGCFRGVFEQKLSYIKECTEYVGGATTSSSGCFAAPAYINYLSGTAQNDYISNWGQASLVLKDGTSLVFDLESNTCTFTIGGLIAPERCGYIKVDVNGVQPPNTWGRDIYLFLVNADKIIPAGPAPAIDTNLNHPYPDDCGPGTWTNRGYTCAAKYLLGN